MARFNINTFSPVYPATDDKRGEIQIVNIKAAQEVGENYGEEMRIDYLPVIQNIGNPMAAGVQTMYRTVKSDSDLLQWADPNFNAVDNFLLPLAGHSTETRPFIDWIQNNASYYESIINYMLSTLSITDTIYITKVHVIDTNIMFSESIDGHVYFQTAKCIFYGQQSPNPNPPTPPVPPPPPCEPLADYALNKQFPINPSPKVTFSTEDTEKTAVWTLIAKGTGSGTEAVTVVGNMPLRPAYLQTLGYTYTMKVETPALVAGSTINVVFKVQDTQVFNFQVSDVAKTLYFPVQILAGSWNNRIEFSRQLPISGLPSTPNVDIKISLSTDTCAIP
jgi:hypothetical protein